LLSWQRAVEADSFGIQKTFFAQRGRGISAEKQREDAASEINQENSGGRPECGAFSRV